ncbi:MAG: apolipoprotein N-acyltransferase [Planctomycetales bacterium 4572_13]|nr:MAG: apolipoprotein N-acyltransferase [Planctomycetales bacterium 4572_13]
MEQKAAKKRLNFIKRLPARTIGFSKDNRITLLLMFASAVLLSVIHPPLGLSFLAWVAWVPFILACRADMSVQRLMTCAYLGGLSFWFGNMYWLVIVSFPGYIAFSIVQAFYWPLLALSVRFVLRKQWPMFLAAPLIFVGAEAIQGVMFTGFGWYYLAHSQYQHLPLIQICDIFGTLGVSALIAMVNGLTVDWINKSRAAQAAGSEPQGSRVIGRLAPSRCCWLATIITAILLAGSSVYGCFRLAQTPKHLTKGPLIGSVQPNVPAYVKEEMDNGQKILDDLIADSEKCIEAGAAMVCWPETMVLAPMNRSYLARFDNPLPDIEPQRFHKQILAHCTDKTSYVLFGANAVDVGCSNNGCKITAQYNAAFLYRPDGTPDPKRYDKIHRVPFGEYIPFRDISWIYRLFMFFNPYDYDYSLTAGTDYTTFEIEADGQKYGFGVLICYEDTDSTVARKLVVDQNGLKKADWLVNISNDGWYVHFKDRQVVPMVELAQRTAISAFRCVENRVSIIRSVNTGISCLIEPTGKIRDGYAAGNLPDKVMDRQGVAGWFADTIPIDSRVTIFSRHGRWLDVALGSGWSIILLLSIYGLWKQKITGKNRA